VPGYLFISDRLDEHWPMLDEFEGACAGQTGRGWLRRQADNGGCSW
jgi:hypothetical protein